MRQRITLAATLAVIALAFLFFPLPARAQTFLGWLDPVPIQIGNSQGCPPDAVRSGSTCIDKYEASVWSVSPLKPWLISRIKEGTATLAALTAAGAIQLGLHEGDLAANGCPYTGNGCTRVYAASIPGVTPSAHLNWFQAVAAARNAGKRLPSNAEWQAAALGTPDPGTLDNGTTACNISNQVPGPSTTGARSACVSDVGAFDMVGNVWEWVADWFPLSGACGGSLFDDPIDLNCPGGAITMDGVNAAALLRGGYWENYNLAGVFAVIGFPMIGADDHIGFRGAR